MEIFTTYNTVAMVIWVVKLPREGDKITVFPHIRPAGIIIFQGLQLRVLLECGHYSRASIIITCLIKASNPYVFTSMAS